ncbi:hypothetical protein WH87_02320 [Devosia epidermidihirudinis]|uniref:histidine kinase n=1 Tax=Devosia epidermidihirudinis TaxID=1293439 RepID=A0A0F5QJX6_9HYPH|nr:ATP-binding protein [Devosia epidermidihirudinis]KKC41003.1 hypothetical protein WH87_02320 [Devosia epidermidihirudinis]
MRHSIRARLLLILLITTGVAWLSAAAWIYTNTQRQVEHVLDARLEESARMVSSLMSTDTVEAAMSAVASPDSLPAIERQSPYLRQLSCQIWSMSGKLVSQSEGAPDVPLALSGDGFSERSINGDSWRVFTVSNAERGVQVMVGDSVEVRRTLVFGVMQGTLLPMLALLPIAGLLIWFSVRRGLSPLDEMAATLANRAADDLQPVDTTRAPTELGPITSSINALLSRVASARARETTFTAFAAHELKTPLAGLKTQAQIALASQDSAIRDHALKQISSGVDRSARMVRQLLDLTAADAPGSVSQAAASIGSVVRDVVASLDHVAERRRVTTVCSGEETSAAIACDVTLAGIAIRNIVENAIAYTPEGGEVRVAITRASGVVSVVVDDDGPGMAAADLAHVGERFFRARDASSFGSGLGLSIAETVMTRCGGTLALTNRADGTGLSVRLTFPMSAA